MKEFEKNKIIIFLIWGIAAIIATLCTLDFGIMSMWFIIIGAITSIIISAFIYDSTLYIPTLGKIIIAIMTASVISMLVASFSFFPSIFVIFPIFVVFIMVLCYVVFDFFENFFEKDEIRLASLK